MPKYIPKPPKIKTPNNKKPPLAVSTSSGTQSGIGGPKYATVTAGGKQFRMGPSTFLKPKPAPQLTLGEQLRLLLQGGAIDNEQPSGFAGVRR